MSTVHWLRRLIDLMAKSGLILRGDPPKVVHLDGRQWGAQGDGLSISIQGFDRDGAFLSVILKNEGPEPKTIRTSGWVHFFQIEVTDDGGSRVPLTAFGECARRPAAEITITALQPGNPVEIELPLHLLVQLTRGRRYSAEVSCRIDAEPLVSNAAAIQA
jgi:hypothetical protein